MPPATVLTSEDFATMEKLRSHLRYAMTVWTHHIASSM